MGRLVCELLASGGKVCHTHGPTGFRVSLSLSTTCLTLRVLAYVPGTPAILGAKALDPEDPASCTRDLVALSYALPSGCRRDPALRPFFGGL